MTETNTALLDQDPQATPHGLVQLLEAEHAEVYFATAEGRQEFLTSMDFGQFTGMLTSINAEVRHLNERDHRMDGTGIIALQNAMLGWSTKEYDPPAYEDRKPLMQATFEAAKTLPLDHAATLTGLNINAIHPYLDGNGRTSRYTYTLFTEGYDGSAESKAHYESLLENTKGRDVVDLSPARYHLAERFAQRQRGALVKHFGYEGPVAYYGYGGYDAEFVEDYAADNILTKEGLSAEDKSMLHDVVSDNVLGTNALIEHALQKNMDLAAVTKSVKQRTFLKLDELLPQLSSEDIQELAQTHRRIKREYVEDTIDIFTNPDRQDEADKIVEFYRPQSAEAPADEAA